MKVTGVADRAPDRLEGSGFVVAPDRVMTNAHVVAGVASTDRPDRRTARCTGPGGPLRRQAGRRRPLTYPGSADRASASARVGRGHSAIVVGFPENGPFSALAARVRGWNGPAVRTSTRTGGHASDLLALRDRASRQLGRSVARHRWPGRSASSSRPPADNTRTGYALTAARGRADATGREVARPSAVSTDGCD